MPSSMIAILIPSPWFGRPACHAALVDEPAAISVAALAYAVLASTSLTPGRALSKGRAAVGTTTAAPLRTRRYRQRTCAVGMDARRAVTNRAWSASTAARAARPASPDRPATAGAASVTTTSLRGPSCAMPRPAGPAGTRLQSTSARPHSVNAWRRGTSARRDEGTRIMNGETPVGRCGCRLACPKADARARSDG